MSKNIESEQLRFIPRARTPEIPLEIKIFPEKSATEIEKLKKEKLLFSFHFLDTATTQFNCGNACDGWFLHLFENIREISKLNRAEFERQRRHYDVHSLNWPYEDFSQFPIAEQILEGIDPKDQLQFRLSSSGGRVHGFIRHNTFYIVWFDPHHNLDPDQRFGGVKYFNAPLTPFQQLELDREKLQEEYHMLDKNYKDLWEELLASESSNKIHNDTA